MQRRQSDALEQNEEERRQHFGERAARHAIEEVAPARGEIDAADLQEVVAALIVESPFAKCVEFYVAVLWSALERLFQRVDPPV